MNISISGFFFFFFFFLPQYIKGMYSVITQSGPVGLLYATGYRKYSSWLHSLPSTTYQLTCQCIWTFQINSVLASPFVSMEKILSKSMEITQHKKLLRQSTISPPPNTDILSLTQKWLLLILRLWANHLIALNCYLTCKSKLLMFKTSVV